jgi:hypothetical protein
MWPLEFRSFGADRHPSGPNGVGGETERTGVSVNGDRAIPRRRSLATSDER